MDAENKIVAGANAIAPHAEGGEVAAMAAAASEAVIAALQALTLMPDASGQVVLPAGVELDDIRVSGRDLIIALPDGTQMVIPDGAIFVPQFVLNGIAVPPLNIAALLIGQETAPAAGRPTSSGGNFADPIGDIGDPFARGDLLPPTQLGFPEPEEREIIPDLADEEPTTIIITPDQPAGSVSATASVNEAGLPARGSEPAGSNETVNSETTTGTIVFDTPDGLSSITLNGVAIAAVGQVFTTPLGRLTITSIAAGNIGYSYTLTDNSTNPNATDVFAVVVTDIDGDTATANLTISIIDDAPTARNDTDSVAAATYSAQTGNVVTGVGTTSGSAGADTQGADGAAVSGFRAGTAGSFAGAGTTINGQYGTLLLNADGSYSYTRNAGTPGGVTDTFSYQLTDGDGDTSTATLLISIADAPVSITSVPTTGGGTIVDEEGLPARGTEPPGSNSVAPVEATSGTITFDAPDGVASVQINGTTITGPGQVITLPTGTFAVTGYNPVAGTLGYTFTLTDNTVGDSTTQVVTVTVTDLDGDTDLEPFTITIIDDTPTARDDSDTQATENAPVTINVITNDTPGADAVSLTSGVAAVAGSLSGTGALVYNNDGSFTYTAGAGEEGVVTFQYQITDGDGDVSTATVTITLLGDSTPTLSIAGDRDVAEAGLPARGSEPAGSDATSTSEIATGALAVTTGNDSIASLIINGINVTNGGSVTGASGTLAVTRSGSTYSYTYTLTDNTSGNATSDSFGVVVTDSDGDSATDTLVIAIIDDVPITANDADSIAAGQYGPATGNVITDLEGDGGLDLQGADGATVSAISGVAAGIVGGSTAGLYGVLTLNADGSYSYVRNAGTRGGVSDVFSYTLTDGDGDSSVATLTIAIADSLTTLDLPTTGEAGTQVDEAGLPAGSNSASTSETTAGTIAYTAPDGPATVTIDGVAITAVGQTFSGAFGTLTITSIANGAIGYSYTLTTNTAGDATLDDFAIVVIDQDGDNTSGTLVIDIVDDVPTARLEIDSVTEDDFADDESVFADGNVITGLGGSDTNLTDGVADTRGADGASVTAIAFGAIAGTVGGGTPGIYGLLTLNADGSYRYVLDNFNPAVQGLDGNDTLTEIFTYTLTDGDGDVRTATLTIMINGTDDPISINGLNVLAPELIVDEDDLSDGSSPDATALTQTGSFTVNGTDGISAILIEGANVSVGQSFGTAYGIFTITSVSGPVDGSATAITIGYRYVLTNNTAHPNGGAENFITEIFDIAVTDTDGSTDSATIEVQIIDDVPTAIDDTDTVLNGSSAPAIGNVITDDEADGGEDTVGADGVTVTAVSGIAAGTVNGNTNGSYGVLTLNSDGSYSYVRNSGSPGNVEDIFSYTITDSDGDTSTATLTISIEDARPIVTPNATVLLDDDALANGNAGGTGDDVDASNVSGTLSGSGGDGALTWTLQLTGAPAGFTYAAGPGGSVLVQQGAVTVLTITLNAATGAYTVTQNAPIQHALGSDENNQSFTLNYTVRDVDGDSTPGTLSINVDDDTPVVIANGTAPDLVVDETTLATNDTENLSSLFTSPTQYGADGAGSVAYALGVVAGPSGLTDTLSGNAVILSLEAGVVVGRAGAGGAVVFTVSVDASGNVTLDQSRAVVHSPNGGPDDVATMAANLITLTQTVTDRDGDSTPATANIGGMLRFVDDAPTAGANAAVQLDDDSLGGNAGGPGDVDPNTLNTSGILSHTFGNDGGSIAFQTSGAPAGYQYVTSGSNILIQQNQGGTFVTVATVTLVPTTGAYTVTQNAPVIHPLGGNENDVSFTLSYLVTDGDLDTAPGSIVINIDDDTPIAVAGSQSGVVDEDGLANGLEFGTGDVPGIATTATGSISAFFSAGADTPLTYQLTGSTAGLPALTSGGVAVTYALAGNVLTASAGANPVFTLTLNTTTGQWDFALLRALDHPNGANENDIVLQFGSLLQATDRDGDPVSAIGTLTITIDDDSPIAGGAVAVGSLSVDETNAVPGGFPISASSGSAMIAALFNYGADGAQTSGAPAYAISLTAGGATTLVTALGGFPITLVQTSATTITGQYSNGGTQTAFTVSINATTGIVTLTQNIALEHNIDGNNSAGEHNDVLTLAGLITATVTITDRDGDSHEGRAQIGGNLSFFDDGPAAVADTNMVTEGAVVSGNVLTDGADDNFGADGAHITTPAGGVVGVAAGNNTSSPVSGGVGALINTSLGSLRLHADGSYTYDALPNTTAVVAIDTFVYTIMDSDGDTSTVTLSITINPVTLVADNDTVEVNEAALNVNGSTPGSTAETNGGTLAVAGAVGYTLPGGGAGTYGTLTLNANGSYSYTLTTRYDSATADNGTNTEIGRDVFTYTATDANGNTITGTISVDIIDDVPTARDDDAGLTEGGPLFVTFDVDTNDTPGADGTGSRTFAQLTGVYGNLTLNVDGTQTYTLTAAGQTAINALAPGATLLDSFSYTLTDGDGDTDPALLTITLTGTDDPPLISNLTPAANGGDAVVDEDDLPAGSDTSPESLTATGNFTITAPDGVDDLTVGGVQVIVNGVYQAPAAVITPLGNTLTFTGYNPATGVVSYSYTLGAAETHANANGENDLFENFAVSLTDVDGDLATDTLSVRIVDDVPTANDDAQTQSAENAPITVNVIANDVRGADGVNLGTGVVAGPHNGTGILVYNGNGTFTYTPGPGEIGPVSFQYTITDADGDSDPATVTLTLLADSAPQVVNVVAAVDDEALAGGIPGLLANGDIDADSGDSGAGLGNEAMFVGQISVNFGNDTGTVSFANLHGQTAMVGTETVTFGWAGTTLTATGPRGVLFTVNLTPSGTYTVTLLDNVLHASGGNEASAPVLNLNYLASDSDGDSNSTGVLAITFNDDMPTLGVVQNQEASNTASDPVSIGTLHFTPGADDAGTAMTITANMTGITSGGRAIFTQQSGNVLTGYADTDSSGGVSAGDAAVFTLTVNPTAGTSGQYVFDLMAPLDGSIVNVAVGAGSSFGVGPTNSVIVADNASGAQLALVTGWQPTGGFTPAELSAWQAGGIPTLTQSNNINGSTAGWGLGNNNLDDGEFLRFDFGVVNDYDGPGGFVPPAAGPFANVSYASFAFANFGTGDTIIFVAHYTDGTTATFTRVGGTDPNTYTINSPAGAQIAWIDVYESTGSIKLDLTNVGVTQTVVDRTIPFTVQLTDGDGDPTSTNSFTVRVGGGLTPITPAAMEVMNLTKFAVEVMDGPIATEASFAIGATTVQQREQAQANTLVAASLIALAGADVALQAADFDPVRDVQTREIGIDMQASNASLLDQATDATATDAITDQIPVMETIKAIELDDMPHTQLWETTGLAPQDTPVVQQAPVALSDSVQLPNSGASMLSLPTDTGLIDALLLARAVPVEAMEPQLAALQDVIADTLNDNGIDHLLDQLAGPVGDSPLMGANDDIASALINMPVASDTFSHISGPSIADQLQDMATAQG